MESGHRHGHPFFYLNAAWIAALFQSADGAAANQALNALLHRRMGGEKIGKHAATDQRLGNKQMGAGGRCNHRHALGIRVDLFQSAGQRVGIAGGLRAGGVGLIFP